MGYGGAIIATFLKFIIIVHYADYGSLNLKDPNHKSMALIRMDEIQAAFLIEKLKNLKDTNERIKIAKKYNFY